MRFLVIVAVLTLAACTADRYPPASPAPSPDAAVPGYADIRFWGDESPPDAAAYLETQRTQIGERARREGGLPNGGLLDVLILSGGGPDGAYGAGLLNGWTARGDRPEFGVVTGISIGALIAPLAFLGPDYDAELTDIFTNTSTRTILRFTPFRAIFQGVGLSDTTGMEEWIARAITGEVIARIAAEHRKGRRLWIGTTNLDAQRPVVWDIGAIAATGRADAPGLIRRIMLASAAIPGAFPPVMVEVEADGESWSEMHVDGGVTRQLFFFPPKLRLPPPQAGPEAMRRGTVYAVRNTKLAPDYRPVAAGILPIAVRSLATLIKSSGANDLLVLTEQARQGGFGLKLTAVPTEFGVKEKEFFDPAYTRALYDLGYDLALRGVQWTDGLGETAPAAAE
jgi:hypothetical protein